ncbi:hypothetical protein ROS217_17652 [Roseovarius sp. 217]|nr:hypothetical protein ROS217_17652 [Roseovarius sp. 217]
MTSFEWGNDCALHTSPVQKFKREAVDQGL